MTLAARVQILTRLACNSLRLHNDTLMNDITSEYLISHYTAIPDTCFTDPAVQAFAAQIQAVLTVVCGLLSAVSAGLWGKLGDSKGRTVVIAIALLGLTSSSVKFKPISTNADSLTGI